MTTPPAIPGWLPPRLLTAHRSLLVVVSIVGIVLGVVAIVWPRATLVTVAIVFGIYLLMSGVFRIAVAAMSSASPSSLRLLSGVLGALVVVAGVYCLVNPANSLVVLAFVIGFGWIAEGVVDIMAGVQGVVSPLWLALVSGIASIVAGLVTFSLPGLAVATFVLFGAVLLIVVSVSTLLTLPRKYTVAA
jgi:uncharacterized membrane protein HdeD (DUF308 family)